MRRVLMNDTQPASTDKPRQFTGQGVSLCASTMATASDSCHRSYALSSENAAKLWKLSEDLVGQKFDVKALA